MKPLTQKQEKPKICPKCLTAGEFGPNKARKDGFAVYCRTCTKEYMATKTYDKDRWATMKEFESARSKAYRERNAESVRAHNRYAAKRKRIENPSQIRANNIARKHGQKRATPFWSDRKQMNAIYAEAKRFQELDGVERHVDHEVPLKHPLVSGLHVPANLRILTATENMQKHNKFVIG